MPRPYAVPRLWPGETLVCLGGGPSLNQEQVDCLRGRAKVIAINDAYRLAPWAHALYACDWRWWLKHEGVPAFAGLKITLSNGAEQLAHWPEIKVLENSGKDGLEPAPTGLRTGRNGGYQAINLAVHLGAKRILLLGYDMKPDSSGKTHWFGDHADWPTRASIYANVMLPCFKTLVSPLNELGVTVINCTPDSALETFPRLPLEDALATSIQHSAEPLRGQAARDHRARAGGGGLAH